MHAIFMIYGMRSTVEHTLRDMEAQKHRMPMYKEGEKDSSTLMNAQVRLLPFGVYEYVFPKEDRDIVLATLGFHLNPPYNIDKVKMVMLRKALHAEKIPTDIKTDNMLPWVMRDISIIPIGIRMEGEAPVEELQGEWAGWNHERI